MANQLLKRALQAVPVYVAAVLLLVGASRLLAGPSVVMAAPSPEGPLFHQVPGPSTPVAAQPGLQQALTVVPSKID